MPEAVSGYVHTITGTAVNTSDISKASKLIRPDDEVVYGDSDYLGIEKRDEIQADEHLREMREMEYRINRRPSSLNVSKNYQGINREKEIEHQKSSVRCKAEHPFLIVKRQFGYAVVYRGIKKNMNRFYVLFASANLVKSALAGRTAELVRG